MTAQQAAHDALEDAQAVLRRYRFRVRLIVSLMTSGPLAILGASILSWAPVSAPIGIFGGLAFVGGFGNLCALWESPPKPHPADRVRAAERHLRDVLTDWNPS